MATKKHSLAELYVAGDVAEIIDRATITNLGVVSHARSYIESHEVTDRCIGSDNGPWTHNGSDPNTAS